MTEKLDKISLISNWKRCYTNSVVQMLDDWEMHRRKLVLLFVFFGCLIFVEKCE